MVKRTRTQIFLAFGILIFFSACEKKKVIDEDTSLEHETEMRMHNINPGDVEILVIDDCEYIIYKEVEGSNKATGYMAHKGNCKNPIHYNKPNITKIDTIK